MQSMAHQAVQQYDRMQEVPSPIYAGQQTVQSIDRVSQIPIELIGYSDTELADGAIAARGAFASEPEALSTTGVSV